MSKEQGSKNNEVPPAPDKRNETTAYIRWLLEWHWQGAPKNKTDTLEQ